MTTANTGRWPQRDAFTLIELLVVVAIIALLISILLPSLSQAKESGRAAVCACNQRQMAVAATLYTNDEQGWMNPLEDWWTVDGEDVEITFRVLLFPYVAQVPDVFDCPAERVYVYADGFSGHDQRRMVAIGSTPSGDPDDWPHIFGVANPLERWNYSGIGIAGVHWFRKNPPDLLTRPKVMPFGRPKESGYREGLHKYEEIRSPGRLIWFGDGASDDTLATWGSDNGWWIKSQAAGYGQGQPGFNRLLQNDYGCRRHAEKANYTFSDGHVARWNANDLRCEVNDCWWSIDPAVHPAGARR